MRRRRAAERDVLAEEVTTHGDNATRDKEWQEERARVIREEGGGCSNGGRRICAPGDEQREERSEEGSDCGAGK